MSKVKIHALGCLRCGYEWFPRKKDVRACPGCKSYLWNKAIPSRCERCGKTNDEYEKNLARHHIDGDHGNDADENVKAVCQSCHMKIHHANWSEQAKS